MCVRGVSALVSNERKCVCGVSALVSNERKCVRGVSVVSVCVVFLWCGVSVVVSLNEVP